MQNLIRLRGFLQGMDREAECTLEIWKEASSRGRVYNRCKITDEPSDLPDGAYTVFLDGRHLHTTKWWGCWELTFLPLSFDIDQVA